ncbi:MULTISPECIES: septal ring lytic transglycosylase RlpA family protein [unclassified Wenzhouxiangella]|uniref:septal ring lytic transglycosylase RlpA family protein n=1 Tax=unclassified Wenzhouxiangella TaxID=2613841 RepID=UPI000E325B8C|nr:MULTISPECIES: septal ring lytic transglycosylase RlpA family protein [unclassified Wenzhouxiangella]RFF27329.1 septal ring lytic transglycosylase RlpA family protein [Wenzhouxiangella sp. 15181]RFP68762.1 septal ring lytic transglycosylase RlpA family protein [Wenzhouxiangella sp. 15190]
MKGLRAPVLFAFALVLVACGREAVREAPDGPPSERLDPDLIERPDPQPEPRSAYGNHSPYEVLGRRYRVMDSAAGYRERGTASWYGTKFQGRPTSSGEPYDLYQLTAAHRTLPLPTWVEVTRLDTGDSIVVRVNDRGPFHPDRIIDLSWAAASELGMTERGTAPVEVRAITFDNGPGHTPRPARVPVYVQVGAFSERERAHRVVNDLERAGIGPIDSERTRTDAGRLWRVRLGPIDEVERAIALVDRVAELGLGRARYVYP